MKFFSNKLIKDYTGGIYICFVLVSVFVSLLVISHLLYITTNQTTYIATSTINGNGLFAKKDISKDQYIGAITQHYTINHDGHSENTSIIEKQFNTKYPGNYLQVTHIGKYINHCSKYPNTYLKTEGRITSMYAIRDIAKDEELTLDYDKWRKLIPIDGSRKEWKECKRRNFYKYRKYNVL